MAAEKHPVPSTTGWVLVDYREGCDTETDREGNEAHLDRTERSVSGNEATVARGFRATSRVIGRSARPASACSRVEKKWNREDHGGEGAVYCCAHSERGPSRPVGPLRAGDQRCDRGRLLSGTRFGTPS